MPVYVDPNFAWPKSKKWPYGSVSHMYADTPEELHKLAKSIGLKREWCSDYTHDDSPLLHYDLNPAKRTQAIRAGAKEVDHKHSEPYSLRGVWYWPAFCKVMKEEMEFTPTVKNFKEWETLENVFRRAIVLGVDLERHRAKQGGSLSKDQIREFVKERNK